MIRKTLCASCAFLWLTTDVTRRRHDVIRSFDFAVGGGALWGARAGYYGFFTRGLFGFDRAWFYRRPRRDVARSHDGPAGAVCRTHRHDQFPDRLVHHRLRVVRGDYLATDETLLLVSHGMIYRMALKISLAPRTRYGDAVFDFVAKASLVEVEKIM